MKEHILIIEDEKAIQSVLYELLIEAGYKVSLAGDGLEGLSLFHTKSFSLILLDIMMPKIDGLTVLENIRTVSDIPIILLTAQSQDEDKLYGYDIGADDYITKPFSTKILVAKVKALLKRTADLNEDKSSTKKI